LGESSPIPALAVGILGILGLIIGIALGVIPFSDRNVFAGIAVVMFFVALLTFASVASLDSAECEFESHE